MPFGVTLMSPLVSVDVISLPLIVMLSTSKLSASSVVKLPVAAVLAPTCILSTNPPVACKLALLKFGAPSVVMLPAVLFSVGTVSSDRLSVPALSVVMLPVVALSVVVVVVCPSIVGLVSVVMLPAVLFSVTAVAVAALSVVANPALITTSPVPFGVRLISPLVSVDVISLPLTAILSTAKSPVTFKPPVTPMSEPSHVRLASSSSSPLVPATTIRLFVKSVTAILPAVAVVMLPVVAFTVVLVVVCASIVGDVSVVMLPAVLFSVTASSVTACAPSISCEFLIITLSAPPPAWMVKSPPPGVPMFCPSMEMLSAVTLPVTLNSPVNNNDEPSNVKLASSSSSPLVPAITTLLLVKSLTAKLPAVAVVILPVVAFTVALVVVPACIVGAVSVVMLPAVLFSVVAYHVAALPVVAVIPSASIVVNTPVLALVAPIGVPSIAPPLTSTLLELKFVATSVVDIKLVMSASVTSSSAAVTLPVTS